MTRPDPSAPLAAKAPRAKPRAIAWPITDLSAFTKGLRSQLAKHLAASASVPTHLQTMNMVARALGHANVQALKSSAEHLQPTPAAPTPSPPHAPTPVPIARAARATLEGSAGALSATAAKAAMQFDDQGRLVRWPRKFSVQRLAMWGLWMHFDSKRVYREREVNEVLKLWHCFGDHVTLRRELINMRLLSRKSDGSAYWKEARRPDDEVRALLRVLRARAQS